jgi:hypothetical protein
MTVLSRDLALYEFLALLISAAPKHGLKLMKF